MSITRLARRRKGGPNRAVEGMRHLFLGQNNSDLHPGLDTPCICCKPQTPPRNLKTSRFLGVGSSAKQAATPLVRMMATRLSMTRTPNSGRRFRSLAASKLSGIQSLTDSFGTDLLRRPCKRLFSSGARNPSPLRSSTYLMTCTGVGLIKHWLID